MKLTILEAQARGYTHFVPKSSFQGDGTGVYEISEFGISKFLQEADVRLYGKIIPRRNPIPIEEAKKDITSSSFMNFYGTTIWIRFDDGTELQIFKSWLY